MYLRRSQLENTILRKEVKKMIPRLQQLHITRLDGSVSPFHLTLFQKTFFQVYSGILDNTPANALNNGD